MTYVDHIIRDTLVETSAESLDIGKLDKLSFRLETIILLETYEVFTMGENTNGSLGHNQVKSIVLVQISCNLLII